MCIAFVLFVFCCVCLVNYIFVGTGFAYCVYYAGDREMLIGDMMLNCLCCMDVLYKSM